MMQMLIMIILFLNSIIFTQMSHPLSMGLILLFQTILTCLLTGLLSKTFWFSYILFLIFIGGMLILFIYMASLSPNEKMSFSMKLMMKILLVILTMTILFATDKFFLEKMNNLDMKSYDNLNLLMNENFLNLSKLYEFPTNMMTIMLVLYLLLTLIVVVKITNSFLGPLRQKN